MSNDCNANLNELRKTVIDIYSIFTAITLSHDKMIIIIIMIILIIIIIIIIIVFIITISINKILSPQQSSVVD